MTAKINPTIQKLATLEDDKKAKIAKLIEQSEKQQKALLAKRKEELFKLFYDNASITMDDQLIIGFLKFASNKNNADHPTLKDFKSLGATIKQPRQAKKPNAE